MADWNKKVRRALRDELRPGEDIVTTVFLQPIGTMTTAVARGVGGALGAAAAARHGGDSASTDTAAGLAASMPDEPTVLSLSTQRLLALGHSGLTGRPKGILRTFAPGDLVGVDVERRRASSKVELHMSDGSTAIYEAPTLGNDAEGFARQVNSS